MRSFRPIFVGVSACGLVLAGCATPGTMALQASAKATAEWEVGGYKVAFRAGPIDAATGRSYSCYEISMVSGAPLRGETIMVESALSTDIMKEVPGSGFPERIRTFTSGSGNTLLIEEVLPVIAWPCNNWILVKREEGALGYDYLDPPQRQVRPTADNREIPRVVGISEREIIFRYSDGQQITVPVRNLVKKENRPDFPG